MEEKDQQLDFEGREPQCPSSVAHPSDDRRDDWVDMPWSNDKSQGDDKSKRRGTRLKRPTKIVQGHPKCLVLHEVLKSRHSTSPPLIVRENESPWDTFQHVFTCKLAGPVMICVTRTRPSRIEAIREYPIEVADKALHAFQRIRHENIVSARECYWDDARLYARVDDLPLTLEHLANLRVNEHQLSSIMSQILNGLTHLIASGFEHTTLTCSNILLGSDGAVKIAALELCEQRSSSQSQVPSIKALGVIMMRLMQKFEKDGADSCAVDFLTAISSARSTHALQQHPFVAAQDRPRGELIALARFALIATKTFYTSKF